MTTFFYQIQIHILVKEKKQNQALQVRMFQNNFYSYFILFLLICISFNYYIFYLCINIFSIFLNFIEYFMFLQ